MAETQTCPKCGAKFLGVAGGMTTGKRVTCVNGHAYRLLSETEGPHGKVYELGPEISEDE